MAESVHADVLEHILIRLDVKLLIRCKRVCKSWHSLITNPGFINRHLNRSYNEDRYNNNLDSRRISLPDKSSSHGRYNGYYSLVGSSNGLVCIISCLVSCKLLVCNPLTREVRQLKLQSLIGLPLLCRGFGYDISKDDYIVVMGVEKGKNQTCFEVLSLKSNVWRVIGEVKYTFITTAGILCNGALHWIVKDQNNKKLVISYDLSKEEFKEIPQPENARYESTHSSYLGTVKECLCIISRNDYFPVVHDVWLMKKYNVKESWEMLPCHHEMKRNIVHYLGLPKDESFFLHYVKPWFSEDLSYRLWRFTVPIFVKSLVSPHKSAPWVPI
ncbi:putative F-box domain, galactose oxidase/kelch, beta-propeller, F-box associated interaction [Helianthus annuus]|nr:putative F-box domain, galactose oxidase/kelch, beta-propeller, F-box associated interaction [Helianthus annuus]